MNKIASIGTDLGNSMRGNTATAVIEVSDYRSAADTLDDNSLKSLSQCLSDGVPYLPAQAEADHKRFTVQFNPSKLDITAKNSRKKILSIEQRPAEEPVFAGDAVKGPHLELSLRLIFDHVVNQDAFLSDKFTVSVSNAAGDIAKAVNSSAGSPYTVQTEVDGLLSVLYNRYTRLVTFNWGDFSFQGTLGEVNVEYVMFSPVGYPIRAYVDLKIIQNCGMETAKKWYEDYSQAFLGGPAALDTAKQKAGNLVNLPI